ncbi:unnamed protein product [Vitrella brassicaformis CCMP3155]|uniref:Uncharacterized protein n=2 Tax=Vitrella brassicaformis TaxID=1169539 RepID=A0A0G4G7J0_VITBC|nr:unnamed protein product [Vitrella brassicaformis CCMP3155]|mmetsp:Transcript_15402/g.36623  ORF Transcript_15402/g.36623 Transcript_15402/m.36623 type:complete len:138 (+) Transcript_15402:500-913(+)|eukprot:CEM24369.1 unnamed protein product [Vitrella brassicaformis CCMP3155]
MASDHAPADASDTNGLYPSLAPPPPFNPELLEAQDRPSPYGSPVLTQHVSNSADHGGGKAASSSEPPVAEGGHQEPAGGTTETATANMGTFKCTSCYRDGTGPMNQWIICRFCKKTVYSTPVKKKRGLFTRLLKGPL